jgi:hypothetical protein
LQQVVVISVESVALKPYARVAHFKTGYRCKVVDVGKCLVEVKLVAEIICALIVGEMFVDISVREVVYGVYAVG